METRLVITPSTAKLSCNPGKFEVRTWNWSKYCHLYDSLQPELGIAQKDLLLNGEECALRVLLSWCQCGSQGRVGELTVITILDTWSRAVQHVTCLVSRYSENYPVFVGLSWKSYSLINKWRSLPEIHLFFSNELWLSTELWWPLTENSNKNSNELLTTKLPRSIDMQPLANCKIRQKKWNLK